MSDTAAPITSTAMYAKKKIPDVKIWAVVWLTPYQVFQNRRGGHEWSTSLFQVRVRRRFCAHHYDMSVIDDFVQVTDKDGAIDRKLAKEEAFLWIQCRSCIQGLMRLKDSLKEDDVVVCIPAGHGSRYVGKNTKTSGCWREDFGE